MIMVWWLLDHILIVGACVVATDDVGEENGLVGTGSVFFVGAVFVGVAVGALPRGVSGADALFSCTDVYLSF